MFSVLLRAKSQDWIKDVRPVSNSLKPGNKNLMIEPLIEPERIIFPPLHIKLGVRKQFFEALDFHGDCFKYICYTFLD